MSKVYKLILVLIVSSVFSYNAFAGGSFLLHLYFDNGVLIFDRDTPTSFEIIEESYEFPEDDEPETRVFRGEIVGDGKIIETFMYDLTTITGELIKSNSESGKVIVVAPFVFGADEIRLHDSDNRLWLTVNVGADLACNQDRTCDDKRGENLFNCPSDCGGNVAVSPSIEPVKSDSNSIFGAILYILGGLALAVVAWVIYRSRKNQAGGV